MNDGWMKTAEQNPTPLVPRSWRYDLVCIQRVEYCMQVYKPKKSFFAITEKENKKTSLSFDKKTKHENACD